MSTAARRIQYPQRQMLFKRLTGEHPSTHQKLDVLFRRMGNACPSTVSRCIGEHPLAFPYSLLLGRGEGRGLSIDPARR